MAWLGNGLSQITGQISNFTKEVLTEGTEEVDDHATELRLARARVVDLESHCVAFKTEVDRLNGLNEDLSEKLESSELQIKAISSEYRSRLDEREEEIKSLKQIHNEWLEQQGKMVTASSPLASSPSSLSHSASMPSFTAFNIDDEDDFGDVISSQHEINRLRSEVQRLQAQSEHWRQVAGAQASSDNAGSDVEGTQEHTAALHAQIKELQQQLRDEIDQHQHELSALQDVQSQKLATLKKKHKQEVQELQEQLQTQGKDEEKNDLLQKLETLQTENSKLSSSLNETNQFKNQLEEKLVVMEKERELLKANVALASENIQKEQYSTLHDFSHEPDEADSDMQQALRDASLPSSTPVPAEKRKSSISSLSSEVRVLREKLVACETEAEQFELQRADWLMEKEALEDVLLKLRQQLQGSGALGNKGAAGDSANIPNNLDNQTAHLLQELVTQKQKIEQLQSQLDEINDSPKDYEESRITSLQNELETNYTEMLGLISNFQEREAELNVLSSQAQKHEYNLKVKDDDILKLKLELKSMGEKLSSNTENVEAKDQLDNVHKLEKEIESLDCSLKEVTQERDGLVTSLEELDAQNQVALEQMIQNRDQIIRKNEELQNKLEVLEKENSKVTHDKDLEAEEIKDLKEQLEATKEKNSNLVVEKELAEKEVTEMKNKIETESSSLDVLLKEKQGLEQDLSGVKGENNDLESKNKSLVEEKLNLEEEYEDLKSTLSTVREELKEFQNSSVNKSVEQKLSGEVEELCEELNKKKYVLEQSETRISELEQEMNNLQGMLTSINQEKLDVCAKLEVEQNSSAKQEEITQSLNSQVRDLNTKVDSLVSQKKSLERELNQSEQKLSDQAKHYDSYITELRDSKDMDTSALQEEHQNLLKACHEKEMTISEMKTKCDDLERELEDTKDLVQSTIDGQKHITDMLTDRESEISKLQTENAHLVEHADECNIIIKTNEAELKRLAPLETQLKHICEENRTLTIDSETLKSQLRQLESQDDSDKVDRTLDVITDLESEVTVLNDKLEEGRSQIHIYEQEISQLKDIIRNQENPLKLANEKCEEFSKKLKQCNEKIGNHETIVNNLQQNVSHREQELVIVSGKLEKAKSLLNEEQLSFIEDSSVQIPDKIIKMQNEQLQQKPRVIEDGDDLVNGESMVTVEDLSKLQDIISQKDDVIAELQTNKSALLELLEERSMAIHGDKTLVQVHKLEGELQDLRKEKEQIMSVLNEKSRECSNLKSETHRLMNVISAEKAALAKLQQDNHELIKNSKQEEPNPDMTRDAVKNLSRMIRDKDLEIESLNQKNQTLLQVLQESSATGSQVAGLMAERDNLTKQLGLWQADREQIITALNQKHQESVAFHTELQRVTALCNQHSEEIDQMKQQYQTLSQQYEDKQQQLVKAQNEVVNYKHKYQETDNRYQELLQQQGCVNPTHLEESSKEVEQLSNELETIKQNMAHLEQTLRDKSEALISSNQLIKDKDKNLTELSGKCRQVEESIYSKDSELGYLRKQAENTQFQMSGLRTEIGDLQQERNELSQQNRALHSEVNILKDSHQKLSMFLGEKDFEINALKEKANTLAKLVAEKGGDEKGEMDRMMRESEAMQGQAQAFQQERDQALMALQQTQAEGSELRDQLSKLTERERKLGRELERLRNHLLAIEEGYTQEALAAEEREKELRNRLAAAEERVSSSSSAVKNASEQATAQVENLQQQLQALAEQRDAAVFQLASAQDTANQYAASLNNLQMVLEQFQRERETQIAVELECYQKNLEHTKTENGALLEKCNILQTQLEESQETIEAAHRLSEQLDRKEEAVMALKEEVLLREKQLLKVEQELNKMTSSNEAKVDKVVIKNLFLGYFHTPTNKRREVLHLIGKVLNFNQEEMDQASTESSQSRGWLGLGGLLRRSPPHPQTSPPTTPHRTSFDKSFSELFVKFLEKESSPTPSLNVKLPAEAMAREKQVQNEHHHQQRQKPIFNPFSAPRHATMPIQVGGVKPDDSHLLMKPMASTLPTFTPLMTPELTTPAAASGDGSGRSSVASSGRSTPATTSAILRDVLQQ